MSQSSETYAVGLRIWNDWTLMWNGQPELARRLVAPRFALHLPAGGPLEETVLTPEAVEAWVIAHRAKFRALRFWTQCGPFVDVDAGVVAGPWAADTSVEGAPRIACGMDTIAFRDGKIIEYWTISKEADAEGRWASFVAAGKPTGF